MSTDRREPQQEYVHKVQAEIKKYEFALTTIVALDHMFSTLKNTATYQGKRLYVPDTEPGHGDRAVTPDIVVETNGQKHSYRAIVEIKESLSSLPANWRGVIDQLVKYRRATGGWTNVQPDVPHDVILAAGAPNMAKFSDWVENGTEMSNIKKWLIILEIDVTKYDGNESVEISRVRGRILHPDIGKVMSHKKVYRVPLYNIVKKVEQLKFYDSHPPTAYIMAILWDHVFFKFVHGKKLQEFNDDKTVTLTISMKQIRKAIMAFAPHSNPNCVRQQWIRDAMLKFEAIRIVSRKGDESFTVSYKRHVQPTMAWIVDQMATLQNGGDAQLPPGAPPGGTGTVDFF